MKVAQELRLVKNVNVINMKFAMLFKGLVYIAVYSVGLPVYEQLH